MQNTDKKHRTQMGGLCLASMHICLLPGRQYPSFHARMPVGLQKGRHHRIKRRGHEAWGIMRSNGRRGMRSRVSNIAYCVWRLEQCVVNCKVRNPEDDRQKRAHCNSYTHIAEPPASTCSQREFRISQAKTWKNSTLSYQCESFARRLESAKSTRSVGRVYELRV
ncbi:hypothetical protein K437DRAFT_254979 [Tilletiaria anomala UBC 951]|uniref:Uncharacterized protein n=1 Tax=Tilletiaria anomala (strain ATCC 24038 / CBS 436.72 / UBC 951) TaxID=1037660 RepID=A0A066WA25_TILAU|nr:uncharacterized protein K437DRAFT_254979 [Tilletiaria anomala UBC 951]KDN50807.1 hypothetical protein K437DRAFT_254979 [Tilletiaria anomala UBC 951]